MTQKSSPVMREFEIKVFTLVGSIPRGKVSTYGHIAKMAGYPNHSRKVGAILKALPRGSKLPWHRVVNSQGKISLPENTEKYLQQKNKLESESILFINNKIKLSEFLWG